MSENAKESKSSKTTIILLIIIIVLLVIGGSTAAVLLLNDKEDSTEAEGSADTIVTLPYENGAVVLDEDKVDDQIAAMEARAEEGYFTLQFKSVAISNDGENFECEIGNADNNNYDMYIDIYMDETLEDELYVSSLIQPGSGIKSFKTKKKLLPGDYESVLVLTQVEDDHATLHAQTMVYLTLRVN